MQLTSQSTALARFSPADHNRLIPPIPPRITSLPKVPAEPRTPRRASPSRLRPRQQLLNQPSNINFTVEGHCDSRGSTEYNLALGDQRASSVKSALVSAGVSANRVKIISYGKEKPFCMEENESCWQQNRRGHFVYQK